jgi:hypothetical protein
MSCLSPTEITQLFSGQGESPPKGHSQAGLEHGLFPIQTNKAALKGSSIHPAVEDPQLDSELTAPHLSYRSTYFFCQKNYLNYPPRGEIPPRSPGEQIVEPKLCS